MTFGYATNTHGETFIDFKGSKLFLMQADNFLGQRMSLEGLDEATAEVTAEDFYLLLQDLKSDG